MAQVEIAVEAELVDRLSESFFWEEFHNDPPTDDDGTPKPAMLIVARVNGLSIKILADEHPPPHFHVSYQGQDASFSIVDCSRLRGVTGLERYEPRIRQWWHENQGRLVEDWNRSRPSDCPVGPINV